MTDFLECTGDLLESDCAALVNPVNCVGVTGKGLALQFKRTFPNNDAAYRTACWQGIVRPGRVLPVATMAAGRSLLIINFPTKRHWRAPSKLADIDAGLIDLRRELEDRAIASVAVPALGCGLGGLAWEDVRPLIWTHLTGLACTVHVYPPQVDPVVAA